MPPTVTGDRLCDGATTDPVIAFLAGLPETIHVPYEPRDDRR